MVLRDNTASKNEFNRKAHGGKVLGYTKTIVADDTEESLQAEYVISAITKNATGVVTANSHPFLTGQKIYLEEIEGMVELNDRFFLAVKINANTFSLRDMNGTTIDTSGLTTYTANGIAQLSVPVKYIKFLTETTNLNLIGYGGVGAVVANLPGGAMPNGQYRDVCFAKVIGKIGDKIHYWLVKDL